MSIQFNQHFRTFTLTTKETSYQMQIGPAEHLIHLYYGRRVESADLSHLLCRIDHGFSPDYHAFRCHRGVSPDVLAQEYTGCNNGDFRISSINVTDHNGAWSADFTYTGHKIYAGKYDVAGMPSAMGNETNAETLVIQLDDQTTGLRLELFYGVFYEQDIITRAARITNLDSGTKTLHKASSLCLDLPFGDWELLHFHGRHAMERMPQRVPVMTGIQTIASKRGASSHHHNPFTILCAPDTTEAQGDCYGFMPVYSGSHKTEVELDANGQTRIVCGIHDEGFHWVLEQGETFQTPEVLLTYTHSGLEHLSQTYHNFIRDHICKSQFARQTRPVLINNWEATYFDFDADKIYAIAKQARELGVDLMVLDDGWFGTRNDDNRGLGDWTVNQTKLKGGLNPLIERINALGMKFGIWVEPEMVNEDSDLYRQHPDWAFTVPDRKPAMGRNQLVLDFSRPEVVNELDRQLTELLSSHHIEYVKWDMNRNMADVFSRALPAQRQGEVFHRYILGVYDLLERLTSKFPHVLFEGCAGGGGRFDAGMLAYFPQIWCSDDTDAVERLEIQCGTSYGYPIAAVGSHVSACPNHQTGRTVPIWTRGVVAMSGTFGYELDLNKLTEQEKDSVREQICRFKKWYDVIQNGDYFRLVNPDQNKDMTIWQTVSRDKRESLVSLVVTHTRANNKPIHIKLRGLDPDGWYRIDGMYRYGNHSMGDGMLDTKEYRTVYSGSTLMYAGLLLEPLYGDYPSAQVHLVQSTSVD